MDSCVLSPPNGPWINHPSISTPPPPPHTHTPPTPTQKLQGPLTNWNPETRAALHKVRDALLARSNPTTTNPATTTADDGKGSPPLSAYVARRRAGAARRRAAAGGGPRVTCL
jgi:hypothetical protein